MKNDKNTYELLENDEGQMMVLLYAGPKSPQNPSFYFNENLNTLEITRNKNDIVSIEEIPLETIEKVKKLTQLYICEMKYTENEEDESEIMRAYAVPQKHPIK
ncbi:MAG: hypothetical protein IJ864_05210 [Alphaproteobacteria bacterium]|nr:hypothetical protein [Alphaproteobacteria bacterium]